MQATDPVFYGGTINGTLTLNGLIACSPNTGRKIDIYNSASTIYGLGLNDFEFCLFGGEGSALTYRVAEPGAVDLAGKIALYVNATGLGLPVGNPISWGSNTLLVDATGALLVNGAPLTGGGGSYNPAAVAITGGTIAGVAFGGGVNTVALTGAATGAAPSVAPAGTAASIDLALSAKGAGSVIVRTGNGLAFGMSASANAVNYIAGTGAATGFSPTFTATGADANVGIWFASKGAGSIFFSPGGVTGIQASNPTNAVNFLAVSGAVAGAAPTISAAGADANVTLALAGKGTGTVLINNVDVEGGTIDNTPIGNITPAAARFTTLSASGTVSGTGITNLFAIPPAIGGTTANTGRFTALTATEYVRRSAATGITASTTNTQAGATALASSVNNITTAAANSAVRLPATAPATGTAAEVIVRNGGANPVNVFPPTSCAINALAANAAFSLAAGTSARFLQLSTALYITA